jgi:hypothetical protein
LKFGRGKEKPQALRAAFGAPDARCGMFVEQRPEHGCAELDGIDTVADA